MTMLLADGTIQRITPDTHADLWWATIGGMGLTGIIIDATFRLIPIETGHFLVDTERVPNLDALLERMEDGDHQYRYSVAWIDLVATGSSLGRSVLSLGNHATLGELRSYEPRAALDPLAFDPPVLPGVPVGMPNVLNRAAVRAFNEFWYRKTHASITASRASRRSSTRSTWSGTGTACTVGAASSSTSSSCRSKRSTRCARSSARSLPRVMQASSPS